MRIFFPDMGESLTATVLLERGELVIWSWRTLDVNSPEKLLPYIESMLNRNYPVLCR